MTLAVGAKARNEGVPSLTSRSPISDVWIGPGDGGGVGKFFMSRAGDMVALYNEVQCIICSGQWSHAM